MPFKKPSVANSLATILKSLYELRDLRHEMKAGNDQCNKECSKSVSMILELGSVVKDWDIETKEIYVISDYSVQLWADKNSGSKVIVALKKLSNKRYTPALFFPVAADVDIDSAVTSAMNNLGVSTTNIELKAA